LEMIAERRVLNFKLIWNKFIGCVIDKKTTLFRLRNEEALT
jgi:hypothetical protein